ncbi:MAG TPA: hypothetical protein VLB75_04195 [Steroidobacteraceae bacterium]|nr:hypothetical protein [Steroidobacteraceae bacterium]
MVPNSAHIGKLLGPALIAITVTEWINLDIFAAAAGPSFAAHVYLNGTLIFIAGLALVRAHNVWSRRWPVLITLVGWFAIVAGLARMAAPVVSQQAGRSPAVLFGSLIVLLAIGIILTYKSFRTSGQ